MLAKLTDGVLSVADAFLGKVKATLPDYVNLETVDDEQTIVCEDGSLLTILEVRGVRTMVGYSAMFENIVMPLSTALASSMAGKAHQVQVWFEEDYDTVRAEIERSQAAARETAKRLQMDVQDVLDARAEKIAESISVQRCFVSLWTRLGALNKSEAKIEKHEQQAVHKGMPNSPSSQDPLRAATLLRNRHKSFVGLVEGRLFDCGVVADILSARQALREIRRSISPGLTSEKWEPCLPGDRVSPTLRKQRISKRIWEVLWPPLARQVCTQDADIVAANTVRVFDRIYSPSYINLFPRRPKYFGELLRDVRDKRLPWRISFLMEGGGTSGYSFRRMLSSLFRFANRGNGLFKGAMDSLVAYSETEGPVSTVRCALCTWAPADKPDLLARRASDLARSVEGWGEAQVSEVTGEPVAGMMSSALGATLGSVATKALAPMSDFLGMMPWAQPASAWDHGAMLFKSPQGRLLPYQPYSEMQNTWISILFAPPGSGKSVLMNASHFALAMGPGFERLPRIAIIDIGPSSSGLVSLIRESLPPNLRHLAVHRRLRMSDEYAINPCDTQLGCRFPTSIEMQFLRNFMTLLATDMAADHPDKGITGLIASVVPEMYKMKSDGREPNRYAPTLAPRVDAAIAAERIQVDSQTTWWEIVDALFTRGRLEEATVANRYAVPLLHDAVTAANSERIQAAYAGMTLADTGENLIAAFSRMMREALEFFPTLSRPTAFDLGNARIAALDLDAVAKSGGDVGDRTTAVMYMLARQVLAKDFYLNKDDVHDMPAPPDVQLRNTVPVDAIRAYHQKRAREIKEDAKRICFDEFHRTSKSAAVREQVIVDMREGRKWRVEVMLASQSIKDFDELMMEFVTSTYVLDGGSEQTTDEIAHRMGFNDPSERYYLQHVVRKPRPPTPGVFLARFDTNRGKYTNLMSLVLSPQEFWAFSTDAENVALRDLLYERMSPVRARKVLSVTYPYGAIGEIRNRREALRDVSGDEESVINKGIIERLADEIEKRAVAMGI